MTETTQGTLPIHRNIVDACELVGLEPHTIVVAKTGGAVVTAVDPWSPEDVDQLLHLLGAERTNRSVRPTATESGVTYTTFWAVTGPDQIVDVFVPDAS